MLLPQAYQSILRLLKAKDKISPPRSLDEISNILLIIATTIIAFLTFLMRQTLIVMSRHIEFDLKKMSFTIRKPISKLLQTK
jgi:ATP-binding cassette subfamily B protein